VFPSLFPNLSWSWAAAARNPLGGQSRYHKMGEETMSRLLHRIRTLVAAGWIVMAATLPAQSAQAQIGQGAVDGKVSVSQAAIGCGESALVTLTVEGETSYTGVVGRPVDIMLIVDRSGSMGTAMPELKRAAAFFVDIVDSATDGVQDGVIAAGTRVGLVSFADTAQLEQPLTIDARALKDSIDVLYAQGGTNPRPAFELAQTELLDSLPGNTKLIIMFTDGVPDPSSNTIPATLAAQAARGEGVEIYVIGLGQYVLGTINQWASDPDDQHVYATVSAVDLIDIYDDISTAFAWSSASLITVKAIVDDHFTISDVQAPRGSVVVNGQELTWTVYQLRSERLSMQYRVTHDGSSQLGPVPVNATTSYSDAEGRVFGLGETSVDVNVCSPLRQAPGSPYMVVQLDGTPHLYLADERGILHWGSDTRSLTGQYIDWNRRRTMSNAEIAALPAGDPLLSHGLVQIDGATYLVKWETEEKAPRLLQMRSYADGQPYGLHAENLGRLVVHPSDVENAVGMPLAGLERGVLTPPSVARGPFDPRDLDGRVIIIAMLLPLFAIGAGKVGLVLRSMLIR
jgi:hypothetical protein